MYLFSRVKVACKAKWEPVSLHVSGAIREPCLLFLLHLLFPNHGSPPRQGARDDVCKDRGILEFPLHPACTSVQRDGSHRTQLLLQCTGWEDVWVTQCDLAPGWRTFGSYLPRWPCMSHFHVHISAFRGPVRDQELNSGLQHPGT